MPHDDKEVSWSKAAVAGLISAALLLGFSWGYRHLGTYFNSAF